MSSPNKLLTIVFPLSFGLLTTEGAPSIWWAVWGSSALTNAAELLCKTVGYSPLVPFPYAQLPLNFIGRTFSAPKILQQKATQSLAQQVQQPAMSDLTKGNNL